MANYRARTMYDLTQSTNTHARYQSVIATGQLAVMAAHALNVNAKLTGIKAEISEQTATLTDVIDQQTEQLTDNANRIAGRAEHQRYAMWRDSTEAGAWFDQQYKPYAFWWIKMVVGLTELWSDTLGQRAYAAMAQLDPADRNCLLGKGYGPAPTPPPLPAPVGPREGFTARRVGVIAAINAVITALMALAMVGEQGPLGAVVIAAVLAPGIALPVALVQTLLARSSHRRRTEATAALTERLGRQYQHQLSDYVDQNNIRYNQLSQYLSERLGYDIESGDVLGAWGKHDYWAHTHAVIAVLDDHETTLPSKADCPALPFLDIADPAQLNPPLAATLPDFAAVAQARGPLTTHRPPAEVSPKP